MDNKTKLLDGDKRLDDFTTWTQKIIDGEVVTPPLHMKKEERRQYVREVLREDHAYRIKSVPEVTEQKFSKLAHSCFSFFRGTALLYYRDYAGIDHSLPQVFTIGDVHPANFGVMPNENNVPFFGPNDFDEAYFAPFTVDIRRGSTGFWLAARENGHSKKHRKRIVRNFVKGYLEGLQSFAKDDTEKTFQYRLDNSPNLIKILLQDSLESRKEFLAEKTTPDSKEFVVSDEIVPHSTHVHAFQAAIDRYISENDISVPTDNKDFFRVRDVAVKKGSGTASLGLERFWILIEGESDKPEDGVILEMKQARRSALTGLVPHSDRNEKDAERIAEQIVQAHDIHLVGADAFYGYVQHDGKSYLIRERSPFKNDIDLDELSSKTFRKYARVCGKALAQTHARSDTHTGLTEEHGTESAILDSVVPEVFINDMVRFAKSSAHRVLTDHKLFKKDFKAGAFRFTVTAP